MNCVLVARESGPEVSDFFQFLWALFSLCFANLIGFGFLAFLATGLVPRLEAVFVALATLIITWLVICSNIDIDEVLQEWSQVSLSDFSIGVIKFIYCTVPSVDQVIFTLLFCSLGAVTSFSLLMSLVVEGGTVHLDMTMSWWESMSVWISLHLIPVTHSDIPATGV